MAIKDEDRAPGKQNGGNGFFRKASGPAVFGAVFAGVLGAAIFIDDKRDDAQFVRTVYKTVELVDSTGAKGTVRTLDVEMDENRAQFVFDIPAPTLADQEDDPDDCAVFVGDAEFQQSQVRRFISEQSDEAKALVAAFDDITEIRDGAALWMEQLSGEDPARISVEVTYDNVEFIFDEILSSEDRKIYEAAKFAYELLCLG